MKQLNLALRAVIATLVLASCSAICISQNKPSGGRIPTPTPSKTPAVPRSPVPADATKRSGSLDRIDGKWWTTGNNFGTSEVVFTQNGANISGEIHFADGRTGTVSGKLANKRLQFSWTDSGSGGGTGWLELSWANFLGGPWRNQRVKDGSWTLNRIEGQWCLNGNRNQVRRVTHDASGVLTIVNEDGTRDSGRLDGPWLYLNTPEGPVKGDMFYKGNRVDWANKTFWTWCGR